MTCDYESIDVVLQLIDDLLSDNDNDDFDPDIVLRRVRDAVCSDAAVNPISSQDPEASDTSTELSTILNQQPGATPE